MTAPVLGGTGYQSKVLPTYLVLDTSSSMRPHEQQLNDALMHIYDVIAMEPQVKEFIQLSVVSFNSQPHFVSKLTEFQAITSLPTVSCGGMTNFGPLFSALRDQIDADIVALTARGSRVLRPVVFLLTDGIPTDKPAGSWQGQLDDLTDAAWKPHPHIISYGFANAPDWVLARVATAAAFAAEDGEGNSEALANALKSLLKSMVASAKAQSLQIPKEVESYREIPLDYVDL
ncbi:VWA domain-containing protein [Kitasatospora sp. NBC_00070]|uniref:vWA domain-containing protein n=1 Tax=Kitasatospora sp. NBC_00070 TaxID=2975962 RepID=UPI0032449DF2